MCVCVCVVGQGPDELKVRRRKVPSGFPGVRSVGSQCDMAATP